MTSNMPKTIMSLQGSALKYYQQKQNLEVVFKALKKIMPTDSIKLSTIVKKAEWTGMAQLKIIRDPIAKFTNFNWNMVAKLYPGELGTEP